MCIETARPGISLALSGGGFRATLFHLGALWRLNELGYLKKMTRICSVSGGSIIAGVLGIKWKNLNFNEKGIARNFAEEIAHPIQKLCLKNIDIPAILGGWLSVFKSPSNLLEKRYNKEIYHDARLNDLPSDNEGPRFIFYATSLQTGASFRFCKSYISDYHIGRLADPDIAIAKAVAASSGFPPVLTPLILKTDPSAWQKDEGSDLYDTVGYRNKIYLTDGGVYDNLGLESSWDFEIVLVSDAGAPFGRQKNPWLLKHSQIKKTLRTFGITSEQTRALRKRWLINSFKCGKRYGTYWGIATDIDDYQLQDAMIHDNDLTRSLQHYRTRLNPFIEKEQAYLINWGYALTDAAMRKHVIHDASIVKGTWPKPKYIPHQ